MIHDDAFGAESNLSVRLSFAEIVSDEKNNTDRQPKPGLDPVLCLKRLKHRNAEEKKEDSEVCAEFDLHKASRKPL